MSRFDKYIFTGIILLIVLGVGITVWILIHSEGSSNTPTSRTVALAPSSLPLTTEVGERYELPTDEETIIVVQTWATWCPLCHTALTEFDSLAAEFSGQPIQFLVINRNETRTTADQFIKTLGLQVVLPLYDSSDHFFKSIEGYTMPETLVFSSNGEILYRERGTFTVDPLQTALQTALAE